MLAAGDITGLYGLVPIGSIKSLSSGGSLSL
jgi:hypothetical protein